MDIAQRYLNGEDLFEIIHSNQKGGSVEATANQMAYELMNVEHNLTQEEKVNLMLEVISSASQSKLGYEHLHLDANLVKEFLLQADPTYKPTDEVPLTGISKLIREVVDKTAQDYRQLEASSKEVIPLSDLFIGRKEEDKRLGIKDPLLFQQAMKQKINGYYAGEMQGKSGNELNELLKQRESEMRALNWTVAFLEYKQGIEQPTYLGDPVKKSESHKPVFATANISDIMMRHIFQNLAEEKVDSFKMHALVEARGMKLVDTFDIMGNSAMYADDAAYLKHLPALSTGVYGISLETGTGAHAITYVKVSEKEGYILDPNGFQVRCGDGEHTIQQFLKLLKIYKNPKKMNPATSKELEHHNLVINKYEKLAIPAR